MLLRCRLRLNGPLDSFSQFLDLTSSWIFPNTLETKVQAMALYESEVRPFPHPTSPVALRASAQRWGSVAGVEAAEAFELIRAIR